MSETKLSCLVVFGIVFLTAVPLFAQSEDLMQREIDEALATSRWRAGPFRLTPQIRIGGGYDSNAFSSPVSAVDDVSVFAAPGVRAVVPMGDNGLVDLLQENGFMYFKDLEQLRDITNWTRARGAIGGRGFVLEGRGEYRTGIERPTSELDVPLNLDIRRLGAEVDFAIGAQQELTVQYDFGRFRYEDPEAEDVGVYVPSVLDRDEDYYSLRLTRHVSDTTSAVVEGFHLMRDYVDDSTERDGNGYGGLGGVVLSPRGDIRGEVLLGFKRLIPDSRTRAEFAGLIGSVDVIFPFGGARLRALFSRDALPSILDNNWFFVENRFGGSLDFYLADRFFIRPGAVFGRNTYPSPSSFTNAEGERVFERVVDKFQIYSFSFNYELRPDVIFRVGGDYWIRDSNFPRFNKDRFVLIVGLTTAL